MSNGRRGWDVLRWRGLGPFVVLAFREALRPLLYWHAYHIVRNEIFPPVSNGPPPASGFEIVVRSGDIDCERIVSQLEGINNLGAEQIRNRLREGGAVAIAYAGGRAVGYTWLARRSGELLAFDVGWKVSPREAVYHDAFVVPDYRGRRLPARLDAALNDFAYHCGIDCAYASIALLNSQAHKILGRPGKTHILTLLLLRIRGINRTWRVARGASRFEARFVERGLTRPTGQNVKRAG